MRFPCLNREHLFFVSLAFFYYTRRAAQTAPPCIIFLLSPAAHTYYLLQYTLHSPSAKIHIFALSACATPLYMQASYGILSVNNFCPCHFYYRKTCCSIILQCAPIYAHSLSHSPQCVYNHECPSVQVVLFCR